MAEWTDSNRLLQRDRVLVLTLGTDSLIPLLDLSGRDGNDVVSME